MAATGTTGGSASGNKPNIRREPVQKILAVFRSYLAEATGFYHDLILKIGAKHGLSQDDLTNSSLLDKNIKKNDKRSAELKRCQLSCHRCLIYLGDLARYKEYYGDDVKNHDWSIAAGFYVKAASLWPASGNPYNQLAVLATYIGDEMLAVYHYFRSLASETPFLTAKDNLILLFEKNRHIYMRLVSSSVRGVSQSSKPELLGKGKTKTETEPLNVPNSENSLSNDSQNYQQRSVAIDHFQVRVVRLNGILFTRTSLETFSEVLNSVMSDLEELLKIKETDEQAVPGSSLVSGRIWGTGPNVLIQFISILIFSVHNVNLSTSPDSSQPTYAEILQRSFILEHACIAMFECVGHIVQHLAKLDDPSNSLFMPAIMVVLEWLSCRSEISVGNEAKEKEAAARLNFWRNCVELLNRFSTSDSNCIRNDENNYKIVLWEDFELWGFTPLLPIQDKLDYSIKPDIGLGNARERCARVERMKHAGKVISNMFDGTDKGIHYDVETDSFYLTGERKILEKKQIDVAPSTSTFEAPSAQLVRDPKSSNLLEVPAIKFAVPTEEEDEEVIVFKPSTKLKELSKSTSATEVCPQAKLDTGSVTLRETKDFNVIVGSGSGPSTEMQPNLQASPFTASVISSPSVWASASAQSLLSERAGFTAEASGTLKDFNASQQIKNGIFDPNFDQNSHIHGPLDGFGTLDGGFKALPNQFESGRVSGSTIDWGSGSGFGILPPKNFNPAAVNWQAKDTSGGSSLWSSDFHKLIAARSSLGVQNYPNLAATNRVPFLDPSKGSLQSIDLTSDIQALSESERLTTHPVVHPARPNLLGAVMQVKPSLQEPSKVISNSNLGSVQTSVQDLRISAVNVKPDSGTHSTAEKPVRRAGTTTNIRPPPGFGPLPAKPPVSLTSTSAFQATSPAQPGYTVANVNLSQKTLPEQSGTFSVDEHLDDYSWLDGYTPPQTATNQSSMLGSGRVVGSSTYAWPTSLSGSALDATMSPFPGMKTMDRMLSPPPFSAPQQPSLSHAIFQQDRVHKQHVQDQLQQQLHEDQRFHQFFSSQIAAQRNQFHQGDQQQAQPTLQDPLVSLQQQLPQSLWPGPNSFVS
ncbi:hypothetical protein KP509_27G021400 [Ceratopteris richardii]|nr:hypothetical protein KP509_27G021400 [Ceratopteris richardii]